MAITKTGIHVDESSSFTNPLVYEENGQVNSIVADSLTPDTRYYTRGYVISDGTTVYSQNTRSFKTVAPEYLTFMNPDTANDIILTLKKNGSPAAITLQSSLNNGTNWTDIDMTGVTSQSFSIPAGKKLIFRGNNSTFSQSYNDYYQFQCQSDIYVSGNIMTLVDKTGESLVIPCNCCFYALFKNMSTLENYGVTLPATTLTNDCYSNLFYGTGITSAPELPALTMTQYCYAWMFAYSKLVNAPDILARTAALGCCTCMFMEAGDLETPPSVLYPTSLYDDSYMNMFYYCVKLKESPIIYAEPGLNNEDDSMTQMFINCSELSKITTYSTRWTSYNNIQYMFTNIASTGDYYNLGQAEIPVGWAQDVFANWNIYTSL